MNYAVLILKKAQKELSLVPQKEYEKIKKSIIDLSENPRHANCLKLTGREGWRLRIGNYRVIYEIDDKDKTVLILQIGHRKYIYKVK